MPATTAENFRREGRVGGRRTCTVFTLREVPETNVQQCTTIQQYWPRGDPPVVRGVAWSKTPVIRCDAPGPLVPRQHLQQGRAGVPPNPQPALTPRHARSTCREGGHSHLTTRQVGWGVLGDVFHSALSVQCLPPRNSILSNSFTEVLDPTTGCEEHGISNAFVPILAIHSCQSFDDAELSRSSEGKRVHTFTGKFSEFDVREKMLSSIGGKPTKLNHVTPPAKYKHPQI